MKLLVDYVRELAGSIQRGWEQFWFTPEAPETLALVRILTGALLLYCHAVWSFDLNGFFGPHGWLSPAAVSVFHDGGFTWSLFNAFHSAPALWMLHALALAAFACLMLGCFTRPAAIVSYLMAVSYAQRVPGATFGLDHISIMLAMYLMIGRAGDRWSIDRWRLSRRGGESPPPAVSTRIAVRLIQLHMCVVYFFAGTAKLQGSSWWSGSALWFAFGNTEYQTLDMTWLADYPLTVNFMTHLTVYWEIAFAALVWPRLTRPLMLAMAIPLHLGIGICLGMMTFGIAMLIGCLAFVPPELIHRLLGRSGADRSRQV